VQRSRDNHYLDCEAMQAACGYLLNVQRIPLPNQRNRSKDHDGRQPETQPEAPITSDAARFGARQIHRRRIIRSSYLGG
jgi:hypothetical protein